MFTSIIAQKTGCWTPSSLNKEYIHNATIVAFANFLYFSFVLDLAIVVCFRALQNMKFDRKKTQSLRFHLGILPN
jgi:hypothetical protein